MKAKKKNKSDASPPSKATASHPYYLAIVAILVYAGFEAYRPALHGPFVYDDFSLPYYSPLFDTGHLISWITTVRPLLMFSYWINFQLSERDPHSYHVFNLLLHLINSGGVYLIVRRLLDLEALDQWRRESLAVFAAALFLLHPIQTESVAWVAGRSESLSALFFLYAFVLFLYRPSGAIGWVRSISILFLFTCALASKEHTATLPILLLLTDVFWTQKDRMSAIRGNWRLYLPMLLGGLVAGKLIWKIVS